MSQAAIVAAVAATGAAVLAGLALASSPPTLSVAKGVAVRGKIDSVVANSRGLTVYTLSGETVHHLKCTPANNCFSAWFPLKTGSARTRVTASHGVRGKLGTLRRTGFRQVTLAGHPLYTFIGDAGRKRRATGEGLATFGGVWHVVAMSSAPAPMSGPTTTTTPYYP